MLDEVPEIPSNAYVIIESDNCASQYKSAGHFSSVQKIADQNSNPSKVPTASKLFCSVLIPHFKLHREFVCVSCAKKNMAHVHFSKTFH